MKSIENRLTVLLFFVLYEKKIKQRGENRCHNNWQLPFYKFVKQVSFFCAVVSYTKASYIDKKVS